jgi:hypothetical protein
MLLHLLVCYYIQLIIDQRMCKENLQNSETKTEGGTTLTGINGRNLSLLWGVSATHALYREDGKWYHHLREFPGALFDKYGYIIFTTIEEYQSSPFLQHGHDLHVPQGISEIPGYIQVLANGDKNSFFRRK